MNRWYQLRRARGAAFLILVGILALLNQWNILTWDKSWPFFIILVGVLALAERAAWTADVRDHQAAQGYGTTGPVPPGQGTSPYWSPSPPSNATDPYVHSNPPAPENPGDEKR